MQTVAKGGMAEVALGELAVTRAKNEDVKKFGRRMVEDHGKANQELAQLAKNKGVEVPKDLDRTHQSTWTGWRSSRATPSTARTSRKWSRTTGRT